MGLRCRLIVVSSPWVSVDRHTMKTRHPAHGLPARLPSSGWSEPANYARNTRRGASSSEIALVTDVEWMMHLSNLFGWMTPGEFKHFPLNERDAAVTWAAAD
jgi:SpoIIAA-like